VKGILQNLYTLQSLDIAGLAKSDPRAAGLRAAVPEGMLANYDRARARGKKGIALLRNNVCTNCRMQVPVAVTVSLTAGMIQVCGNCGLYLCLPEPDAQPVATPAEAPKPRQRRTRKNSVAAKAI
jgi:predicted  nucleic acid-binding Zn-ribbon protein